MSDLAWNLNRLGGGTRYGMKKPLEYNVRRPTRLEQRCRETSSVSDYLR